MTGLQPAGLSHSEIPGSKVICTYPRLIAAYHVLHRLREPRHPPCALSYFLRLPRGKTRGCSSYFQLSFRFHPGERTPGERRTPKGDRLCFTVLPVSICQRSCGNGRKGTRGGTLLPEPAGPDGGDGGLEPRACGPRTRTPGKGKDRDGAAQEGKRTRDAPVA